MAYHKIRTSNGKYKFVKRGTLLSRIKHETGAFIAAVLIGYALLDIALKIAKGIN